MHGLTRSLWHLKAEADGIETRSRFASGSSTGVTSLQRERPNSGIGSLEKRMLFVVLGDNAQRPLRSMPANSENPVVACDPDERGTRRCSPVALLGRAFRG